MAFPSPGCPYPPADEHALDAALPPKDHEFPGLLLALGAGAAAWFVALLYVGTVGVRPEASRRMQADAPVADGPARVAAAPVKVVPAVLAANVEPAVAECKDGCPVPEKGLKLRPDAAGRASFNTAIPFHKNPVDAFKQAQRDGKLVLMVHIAGNFEEQEFT